MHECKPNPAPLFTELVKCWRPEDKLPDDWVFCLTKQGGIAVRAYNNTDQKGWWGIGEIHKGEDLTPLVWFESPKQPLQLPAPWRECVAGSMPEDVGYEEERFWYVGPRGFISETVGWLHPVDSAYWTPYQSKMDFGPLEEYIKAKEAEG